MSIVRGLLLFAAVMAAGAAAAADLPAFFARLDLTRPGLEQVRAAVETGDYTSAAARLKAYYQARREPHYIDDRAARPAAPAGGAWAAADKVLARQYSFVGKPGALEHHLDWNANPFNDVEWPIELNRHYTWVQLAQAYWQSHDEKYAADLCYQLSDWLADSKRPTAPLLARYTWRTLECGIRLSGSWPEMLFRTIDSPSFTPELLCETLEGVWQQADYLTQFHGGGNWLITEKSGQLTAGVIFPEFKDAPRWTTEAWEVLSRELRQQVLPDGAQVELTPHYHGATLNSFRNACDVAVKNGVPLPPGYSDDMRRMYEYLMYVVKPDVTIPMFNDSDRGDERGWMAEGAKRYNAPDMLYLATGGKQGRPPTGTSHAFPWAGQYVMRSGWTPDDVYLALDAGPYGYGHQHEDKLGLEVWGFGQDLIVDPGRYTYAGGKWRSYFLSTGAHSTVLVDGQGQRRRMSPPATWVNRAPQPNRWFTSDHVDYVTGSYDERYGSAAGVVQVRKIVFVRSPSGGPRYFLVSDLLLPTDTSERSRQMTVQYQLARPGATLEAASGAVNSARGGVGLLLQPVAAQKLQAALHEGEEDPPAGWVGWSLHRALKEPATLVRYTQAGALPLGLTTVLLPYRGTEAPRLTLRRLPVAAATGALPPESAEALEIRGDGWRDLCYLSHRASHETVTFADLRTDAELAVVRFAGAAAPQTLCLLGGTLLASAAEPAPTPATPEPAATNLTENRLSMTAAQPSTFTLRYGYAAGGGYLFETPATAPALSAVFRLADARLDLPYVYEITASAGGRPQVVQRGLLTVLDSRTFRFDGGDLEGWSGSNARLVAGHAGSAGALRAEDAATAEVHYLSVNRPTALAVTPQLQVGLAFRSPLADGGDYCYSKVTLHTEDGNEWSAYFARAPLPDWQKLTLTLKDFRGDTYRGSNNGKPLLPGPRVTAVIVTLRKGKTTQPVVPCFELDDVILGDK